MVVAAPPPTSTVSRWRRLRTPLATAAGIGLAAAALRLRDPHQHGSWGLCPFKAMTGWDCPGCGGLRAVNDLTHGQFVDAWHSNALFLGLIPVIVAVWMLWAGRAWTGSQRRVPARVLRYGVLAMSVVAIGFTVYRNLPAGSAFYVS